MPTTLPTTTPRILTLAPESITRPVRSETSATGTSKLNVRAKIDEHSTATPRITATSTSDHHAGWIRLSPLCAPMPLAGEVEVAGLAVDCQRKEQGHEHHRDQ